MATNQEFPDQEISIKTLDDALKALPIAPANAWHEWHEHRQIAHDQTVAYWMMSNFEKEGYVTFTREVSRGNPETYGVFLTVKGFLFRHSGGFRGKRWQERKVNISFWLSIAVACITLFRLLPDIFKPF